jgi:hypothetical protein
LKKHGKARQQSTV